MTNPTQHPDSHLSSNLPVRCVVLGILNITFSPNGTNLMLVLRPFIIWNAVRPLSLTRHIVMRCPACLTSHGTIGSSNRIFDFVFDSKSDLSVRANPSRSCMARSTFALELLSPTREFSIAVPCFALFLAMQFWMSVIDDSWSVLTMILSSARPIVSMSSIIWSTNHSSDPPFALHTYPHTLLHIVSIITSTVRLVFAISFFSLLASVLRTSSVR